MSETTTQRDGESADAWTMARSGKVEQQSLRSGVLALVDPADGHSRVVGGALVELGPDHGNERPRVLRLDGEGAVKESGTAEEMNGLGPSVQYSRQFAHANWGLRAEWSVTVSGHGRLAKVMLTVSNEGIEPVTVRRLFPFVTGQWWGRDALRIGGRTRDFAAYKNGWQSWSYAGGLPVGRGDLRPRVPTNVAWHCPGGTNAAPPGGVGVVDVVSEEMGLIGHSGQPVALLAGFLSADRWLGQVYAQRRDASLAAVALLDDYVLRPGEAVSAPPLVVGLGPWDELVGEYAVAVTQEVRARVPQSTPVGWCSWYYYFTNVSEADVLENLTQARALRGNLPLDVLQIDDGYQTAIGDWLSVNDKFPHGMKWLAHRVREAGIRPGLWLAPFTIAANSRLAREHPDWLVHDGEGRPVFGGHNWNTDLYGLDTSHPEARAWLRELMRTVVCDWGFDYVKLDFLVCGALAGQRHDPVATRASALRDGLALIRETVGDEVFILGCGCPLLGAVGMVDAMRIGPDGAPHWGPRYSGVPVPLSEGFPLPGLEGALRNTLTRAWMHGVLWANDPDCLIVRERESELSPYEVRAFASAIGLTGGMVLASDRLAELSAERLNVLARLLPPMRERALPATCFAYGIPEQVTAWIHRPWGTWLLVGIFNGANEEREMEVRWSDLGLEAGIYHAVEFWSGCYLGRSDRGARVRVGEHGAAVLAIRRGRDEPQLLSTSFHISQGGVEIAEWVYDRDAATVRWRAALGREATGSFTIWLPDGLYPGALVSTALAASWRREASGAIVVSAAIRDGAEFALALERRL